MLSRKRLTAIVGRHEMPARIIPITISESTASPGPPGDRSHFPDLATGDPDRSRIDNKNPDPALQERELPGLELFSGFHFDGEDR